MRGSGRRIERAPEGIVGAKRLEVGVAFRERPILGVERDRALEVCDRLSRLAALGVRDREHVKRVVVVGVFVPNQPQVRERLIVAARR